MDDTIKSGKTTTEFGAGIVGLLLPVQTYIDLPLEKLILIETTIIVYMIARTYLKGLKLKLGKVDNGGSV